MERRRQHDDIYSDAASVYLRHGGGDLYVPYAVLGAMTFPAILYSTSHLVSAAVGLAVSVLLAWFGRGLLTVALSACAAVYLTEWLMMVL